MQPSHSSACRPGFVPQRTPPRHVRIDHRRPHIPVPQQLLDRTKIVAALQQVGCKRMSKWVTAQPARGPRLRDRTTYSALEHRRIEMRAERASAAPCLLQRTFGSGF